MQKVEVEKWNHHWRKEMKEMKAKDAGAEHKDHAAAAPKEEVQKAEDPHAAHQH